MRASFPVFSFLSKFAPYHSNYRDCPYLEHGILNQVMEIGRLELPLSPSSLNSEWKRK